MASFIGTPGCIVWKRGAWRCSASNKQTRRSFLSLAGSVPLLLLGVRDVRSEDAVISAFQTKTGLKYVDFRLGEGPTPQWGDLLNIHYVAYTISQDGQRLIKEDSTYDRGDHGYLLHHGNGETIQGIEQALHTMAVGARRRVIIPSRLAYVDTDLGPVPPRTSVRQRFSQHLMDAKGTVVFDLELRKIMQEPDSIRYYQDLVPDDEQILQMMREAREDYLKHHPPSNQPYVPLSK